MRQIDYPLYGYLYKMNGTHNAPRILYDADSVRMFVKLFCPLACSARFELRIVGSDHVCLWHIKDGHVVSAGNFHPETMERLLTNRIRLLHQGEKL